MNRRKAHSIRRGKKNDISYSSCALDEDIIMLCTIYNAHTYFTTVRESRDQNNIISESATVEIFLKIFYFIFLNLLVLYNNIL